MAFKPRFRLDGERLELLPNPIDSREKFFELSKHLDGIQRDDYFYERRFRREAFRFPYLASCLANPRGAEPCVHQSQLPGPIAGRPIRPG